MEPEEAYKFAQVLPLNMQPRYQANREVFDEFYDPYEQPQVRLRPRQPSNEVMCMPKDDVGRTCPQLLPPEPVAMPPSMCNATPSPTAQLWGDGYINNFGEQTLTSLPAYFPQPVVTPAAAAPWYFPRNPAQGQLRPATQPHAWLGPVVGSTDPTRCAPGTGVLRLGMEPGAAGAITSLRWKGFEYLQRGAGPSRESALQMSVASNIPPGGTDQQRRANEAGGAWNTGAATSSRLTTLASGRVTARKMAAFTRSHASWWLKPGAAIGARRVLNTTDLSPFGVTKRVTLGPSSFKYVSGVEVPAAERPVSLRLAMRLAVRRDLNRAMAFHWPTQRWVALPHSRTLPAGRYRALVVSNADGTRALGFTLMDFPKPPVGWNFVPRAYYAVNVTNGPAGTLMAAVHQVGVRGGAQPLPTRTYSYHSHFEVGTLQKVTRNLANLAINLSAESQMWELPRGWTAARFRRRCRAPPRRVWVDTGMLDDPSQICRPSVPVRWLDGRAGDVFEGTGDIGEPLPPGEWRRRLERQGWRFVGGPGKRRWVLPGARGRKCRIRKEVKRCATCGFANLSADRCAHCVDCSGRKPKPGPKKGTAWEQRLRRQGWRFVKGRWVLPGARGRKCRIRKEVKRCATCGFPNLGAARCANCVDCTGRKPPASKRAAEWRRRLLKLGWRLVKGRWVQPKGAKCALKKLARCKACGPRAMADERCIGCVDCRGGDKKKPSPAEAEWRRRLLAMGWRLVKGRWQKPKGAKCTLKKAAHCKKCNSYTMAEGHCATCLTCVLPKDKKPAKGEKPAKGKKKPTEGKKDGKPRKNRKDKKPRKTRRAENA